MITAFGRLVNTMSNGKKRARDYGTGDYLYAAEIHQVSIIGNNPGITATEIVQRMGITKGAVSQLLKKLIDKGYVTKHPNAENMREYRLHLTKKGQIAHRHHDQQDHELEDRLMGMLSDVASDDLVRFSQMLNALTDFIQSAEIRK